MQTRAKQERIVEAVRRGFEGDAAVEFIHQSGYAMTVAGIARHLRTMGGRGRIQELVDQGLANLDILQACFPKADLSSLRPVLPAQGELFREAAPAPRSAAAPPKDAPLYETAKLTLRLPADLYEAVRLAAKAEKKTQTDLIVEILTTALSQMPKRAPDAEDAE